MNAEHLFIGGCPRSGTTWLQLLISGLPGVSTGPETHSFDIYVDALRKAYVSEAGLHSNDGIRHLFDETAFETEILHPLVRTLIARFGAAAGGGRWIVEKTPSNLRYHGLISRIFPSARLLAIVRDPRAVAASWKAAATEDWGAWTRKPVGDVASNWVRYCDHGVAAAAALGERYKELRYEDLHASGQDVLAAIAAWMDIEVSPILIQSLIDQHAIGEVRKAVSDAVHPSGMVERRSNFFRFGQIDSWREELTAEEIESVEDICGPHMARYGYSPAQGKANGEEAADVNRPDAIGQPCHRQRKSRTDRPEGS
jgi:hypothetical protein